MQRVAVEVLAEEESRTEPVIAKGTRDVAQQAQSAELGQRIALIAHDLKTPLSIIMLETQLLGENVADVSVQKSLSRIQQNTAYIDRLVGDLLDLATADAGQLLLRRERLDLVQLLGEVLDRAVSSLDRDRVVMQAYCPAAFVHADRNRLERVVANLISNALKYSATPVNVAIEIAGGKRARVTVIDRGQGLTNEQARTIFDRYRRAQTEREGYGLGLYISHRIIDAHGGRLGVVSSPGQGSEFYFELDTVG
jgi:signal transduction histidine kinase